MSKNHPHDNIYSILGKLEALKPTPQEKYESVLKQIHESVEAQGSIIAGVDSVQARLAEAFAAEKAINPYAVGMAAAKKKFGYGEKPAHDLPKKVITKGHEIAKKVDEEQECPTCGNTRCSCNMEENVKHTGTYGTEYYKSDDFTGGAEDEAKAKKKSAKVVRHGVKGRPANEKPAEYTKMNDPFGRVPDKAPKGTKGRVHSPLAEMMMQVERRLTEGVNFQKLMQEKHQTVDEMIAELQNDMKVFKETGHCSELLKDCMEIKGAHGKMVADETAQHGIGGNFAPVPVKKPHDSMLQGMKDFFTGKPEQGQSFGTGKPMPEDMDPLAEELNKLAELAGLTVEAKGKKPDADKDSIPDWADKHPNKAGGDKDRIEEEIEQEGNLWGKNVRDAKAAGKTQADLDNDGDLDPVTETGFDQTETPEFTVNSTVDSDGKKSVNINAEGERAEELLQMLAMAGMGNSDKAQELRSQEPVEIEMVGEPECEVEEAYGDEVIDEPVDEPVNNAHHYEYQSMQSTLKTGDADSTGAHGNFGGPGDNKMATRKNRPLPVTTLEARLAAEYDSIKKLSK